MHGLERIHGIAKYTDYDNNVSGLLSDDVQGAIDELSASTNTIQINQTAFVDDVYGNDATGFVGIMGAPFKTYSAARAAIVALGDCDVDKQYKIVVQPGTYTESLALLGYCHVDAYQAIFEAGANAAILCNMSGQTIVRGGDYRSTTLGYDGKNDGADSETVILDAVFTAKNVADNDGVFVDGQITGFQNYITMQHCQVSADTFTPPYIDEFDTRNLGTYRDCVFNIINAAEFGVIAICGSISAHSCKFYFMYADAGCESDFQVSGSSAGAIYFYDCNFYLTSSETPDDNWFSFMEYTEFYYVGGSFQSNSGNTISMEEGQLLFDGVHFDNIVVGHSDPAGFLTITGCSMDSDAPSLFNVVADGGTTIINGTLLYDLDSTFEAAYIYANGSQMHNITIAGANTVATFDGCFVWDLTDRSIKSEYQGCHFHTVELPTGRHGFDGCRIHYLDVGATNSDTRFLDCVFSFGVQNLGFVIFVGCLFYQTPSFITCGSGSNTVMASCMVCGGAQIILDAVDACAVFYASNSFFWGGGGTLILNGADAGFYSAAWLENCVFDDFGISVDQYSYLTHSRLSLVGGGAQITSATPGRVRTLSLYQCMNIFSKAKAAGVQTILVAKAANYNGAPTAQPDNPQNVQIVIAGGGGTESLTATITGINGLGLGTIEVIGPYSNGTHQGEQSWQSISNIQLAGTWAGATLTTENGLYFGLTAPSSGPDVTKEIFDGANQAIGSILNYGSYNPTGAPDGTKDLVVIFNTQSID